MIQCIHTISKIFFCVFCFFALSYPFHSVHKSRFLVQKKINARKTKETQPVALQVACSFFEAFRKKYGGIINGDKNSKSSTIESQDDLPLISGESDTASNSMRKWLNKFVYSIDSSQISTQTPSPTYSLSQDEEYLNENTMCYDFDPIWWNTNYTSVTILQYSLQFIDGSPFESESESFSEDVVAATLLSLSEYWQCRMEKGFYLFDVNSTPHLSGFLDQDIIRVSCIDSCTNGALCKDLYIPKIEDECVQTYLAEDPNSRVIPKFDYSMEYEMNSEGNNIHQMYEYSLQTFATNPLVRQQYGTIISSNIPATTYAIEKDKLKDLFHAWNLEIDEFQFQDYCQIENVQCIDDLVAYLNVTIPPGIGFKSNKINKFKNSLIELRLNLQIMASFPTNFKHLSKLQMLQIRGNEMMIGDLPTMLGSLIKLKDLDLNSAGPTFGGSLPKQIGNLNLLQSIDLGNNGFTNNIPDEFYQNTRLKSFYFHMNKFTGTISDKIGDLRRLKHISLSDNSFTGTFPSKVNKLTRLLVLDLQDAGINNLYNPIGFTGPFPDISDITNIQVVALNGNDFSGTIPSDIGNLKELRFLNLRNNKLTGPIPSSLAECTKLKVLLLEGNNFDSIPSELRRLLPENGGELESYEPKFFVS